MTLNCKRLSGLTYCRESKVWFCLVILLFTTVINPNSHIFAQRDDGGPVIVGKRKNIEIKTFGLTDLQIAVELIARYEKDVRNPKDAKKIKDTENIFTERLIIFADGFIMHPNVFDMSFYSKLDLSQENVDSDTLNRSERNAEFFSQYDFSGTLVKNGDLPITFYARKIQNKIDRQFSDSFDNVTTEFGSRIFIKSKSFPTNLNIYRRDQTQSDQRGNVDYSLIQDTFEWLTRINAGEQHQILWDYSLDRIAEGGDQRQGDKYDRHDATLTYDFFFGEINEHSLRSWVNAFKQTGDFAYDRFRMDERLRIKHTKSFETDYLYLLNWQKRNNLSQIQHRGQAGIIHQLYDSLTTTAYVGSSFFSQSDGFNSDEIFGNVSLLYRKNVPYGRLLSNLDLNYNRQDNGSRNLDLEIIDERHTFNDPDPIIINRRNIIQNSIVITDLLGFKIFIEGVDYTIALFPDRIEVTRLITGDILDGDAVLIDYRIGPEPGNTLTSKGMGFGLRYDIEEGPLRGIAIYSRFNNQNRSIQAVDPEQFNIGDVQDIIFGAEYRVWRLKLIAEKQIHDSTISPYEAIRLNGQYSYRVSRGTAWFINADHQTTDFEDDNSTRKLTTISGRWYEQLTQKLSMSVIALWRMEEDSNASSSEGYEQRIELNWKHRQTHIYLRANNSFVNTETSDNNFQILEIGYRRDF